MLNLAEYRTKPDRLADLLPWAALVAPGIILNKDGSFQRSFRFRGPDLDSVTEAELVGVAARANNALRRLGSGWALFIEAERRPAPAYPAGHFPDPVSELVDAERRAAFERTGRHYESQAVLTLLYLPPADPVARAGRWLVETGAAETGTSEIGAGPDGEGQKGEVRDWRQELAAFRLEADRVIDLLGACLPEVQALSDAETLTYLHGAISTKRHPVAVPAIPFALDGLLVDMPLTGGLEPMLGDAHLRTLTLLGAVDK